jgi:hypothetical protein
MNFLRYLIMQNGVLICESSLLFGQSSVREDVEKIFFCYKERARLLVSVFPFLWEIIIFNNELN